jgi:hypothetical protein
VAFGSWADNIADGPALKLGFHACELSPDFDRLKHFIDVETNVCACNVM